MTVPLLIIAIAVAGTIIYINYRTTSQQKKKINEGFSAGNYIAFGIAGITIIGFIIAMAYCTHAQSQLRYGQVACGGIF